MKKLISISLIVVMLVMLVPVIISADVVMLAYSDVAIDAEGLLTLTANRITTTKEQTLVIPSYYIVSDERVEVKGIASKAFSGQGSIKGPVVISEGIESIGVSAFQSCSAIASFTIPSTVTSIGAQAFQATSSVERFTVSGASFAADGNKLYTADYKELICYGGGSPDTAVVFPEGLRTIRAGAMRAAANVKYICFPSTLSEINTSGVYGCTALKTVVFQSAAAPAITSTNFNSSNVNKIAYNVYYPEGGTGYNAASFTKCFEEGSVYKTYTAGNVPGPQDPDVTAGPTGGASPTPSVSPSSSPLASNSPEPTEEPVPIDNPELYINEICASNTSTIADKFGDYEDWIEIYNASEGYACLEGYGLSDKEKTPMMYVIPKVYIAPKGYLVIFTATNNRAGAGDVYANFGISKSGDETIYLTKPDGTPQDSLAVPALGNDKTCGRKPDGSGTAYILNATPGQSNNDAAIVDAMIPAPEFSAESGFYGEEFTLSITAGSGLKVYYTTDGSDPDPQRTEDMVYTTDHDKGSETTRGTNEYTVGATAEVSGSGLLIRDRSGDNNILAEIVHGLVLKEANQYAPKVKIDKCMVVRAVACDSKGNLSPVITKSYFVGPAYAGLQQKYAGVPIISLVTDNRNLYDYYKGIFTLGSGYFDDYLVNKDNPNVDPKLYRYETDFFNYMQKGREWERPAHMDYFEEDGTFAFSQDVGIRVRGRQSRAHLQKSFNIYARGEYGKSTIDYTFFPDDGKLLSDPSPVDSFKSVMLRNGGDKTDVVKFHDPLNQSLIADSDAVATQDYRNAVVFINGEFWGPYCLQERFSEEYVENHYGVPADDVVLSDDTELFAQYPNDSALFIRYNDCRIEANYQAVQKTLDIYSAIDYFILQTYIANMDWVSTNIMTWHSKTVTDKPYQDGRLRYMLYDTDRSLDNPEFNTLDRHKDHTVFGWIQTSTDPRRFPGLLANSDYRQKFVTRAMDLINVNFDPDRVNALIDANMEEYRTLMPLYYQRFKEDKSNSFETSVASNRNFFEQRPQYYIQHLKEGLELGDAVNVTLNVNDQSMGKLNINTAGVPLEENTWTGKYFTDYPVTVTAKPKPGYKFKGWSSDGVNLDDYTNQTVTVSFSQAFSLTAEFEDKTTSKPQTGEENDPYLIETADDLMWMSEMVSLKNAEYGSKYYTLCNDIILDSEYENNITAIGTSSDPFNGHFDGGFHTIDGININSGIQGQGLFGYVGENGEVKNVFIKNVKITSPGLSAKNIGAIVGNNKGIVINCYSTGLLEGASTVGGITGNNTGNLATQKGGIVKNCYSICSINSVSASTGGGVAGKSEYYALVKNCYSLITPVAKISDGGSVDSRTRRMDQISFTDGTVASLLNYGEAAYMQGAEYPVFGTVRIINDKITVIPDASYGNASLVIASYGEEMLEEVGIYSVNLQKDVPCILPVPEKFLSKSKIKAMVWADISNVQPLGFNIELVKED